MSKPSYYILIRSYEDTPFVSVWLSRKDGPAHAALLHGEMIPAAAEEIAAATGLPVERETSPLSRLKPLGKPGCVPVAEQQELFT